MQLDCLKVLNEWEVNLGKGDDPKNPLAWITNNHANDCENQDALLQCLYQANFHKVFIAKAHYGDRQNWLQLWMKVIFATRRNVNIMPSVMYSIGPCIVIEKVASQQQQDETFFDLIEGRQYSFGLSEPTAGTQLTCIQTRANKTENGWCLQGEKNPLGWSTLTSHAVVLAKTAEGGPASLSFFKVPLDLPSINTKLFSGRGMAGQSFARIEFDNVQLEQKHLIGEEGRGFELTLQVQQIVKYLSTAANVGACHSLLREAFRFSDEARHGRTLTDIPAVKEALAMSTADLLLAELTALSAGCILGAKRAQFSVASSVVKQTALQISENILSRLRDILSIHYALDCHPIFSRYHKISDDLSMVRFIDTNPAANLKNIATQLPELMRQWKKLDKGKSQQQLDELMQLCTLEQSFFDEEKANIAVTNAGGDYILNAIKGILASVDDIFTEYAKDIYDKIVDFDEALMRTQKAGFADTSAGQLLAKQYCHLHSCASALLVLRANPELCEHTPALLKSIALQLALHEDNTEFYELIYQYSKCAIMENEAISILPVRLNDENLI